MRTRTTAHVGRRSGSRPTTMRALRSSRPFFPASWRGRRISRSNSCRPTSGCSSFSHPLEEKVRKNGFISPADAERFPQVIANAQPDRRRTPNGPAEGWFQPKHGRAPVLHLPFFLAAPYFLEGSDALCVLPRALAELALDPGRFSLLPAPVNAPTRTMRLAWHKRTDEDPYFQWVRGLFEVLLREREAPQPAFAPASSKSLTQKEGLSREETGTAGAATD